ncbi:hypothetical protein GGI04_005471 [Coemansia thaxteri]|nr:hypothetical protein GGI04_005471 [Coemansia thaxteri]
MQEELPREPSSDNGSDVDCSNIEECIGSMVAQRDQLRRRFKEWANDIDYTAKRMQCITNNALVNQSTRLEQILSDGKTRIDGIVGDQSRIRDQLASFVSILSNAQSQIFGDLNDHMPFADSSKPCTDALPPAAAPSATHLKRRQTRDGSHA